MSETYRPAREAKENRAWTEGMRSRVQERLLGLAQAERSVQSATSAYAKDATIASQGRVRSTKAHFKIQLEGLIGSAVPLTADYLVEAGSILALDLEKVCPSTKNFKQQETRFRESAAERVQRQRRQAAASKGKDGEESTNDAQVFSVSSYRGVDLFHIEATSSVAADVHIITWTLVECARAVAARVQHEARQTKTTTMVPDASQATEANVQQDPEDSEETESDEESIAMAARAAARRIVESSGSRSGSAAAAGATALGIAPASLSPATAAASTTTATRGTGAAVGEVVPQGPGAAVATLSGVSTSSSSSSSSSVVHRRSAPGQARAGRPEDKQPSPTKDERGTDGPLKKRFLPEPPINARHGTNGATWQRSSSTAPAPLGRSTAATSGRADGLPTSPDALGCASGETKHPHPVSLHAPSRPAAVTFNGARGVSAPEHAPAEPTWLSQSSGSPMPSAFEGKASTSRPGPQPGGQESSAGSEQPRMMNSRGRGACVDGGGLDNGPAKANIGPSWPANAPGVAQPPVVDNRISPKEGNASDRALAGSARGYDATASDGAPSGVGLAGGRTAVCPSSVDLVPPGSLTNSLAIAVGDKVEYRWPNNQRWYHCEVSAVTPREESGGQVVELEYLPPKKVKTKRVRQFSEQLEVAELLADGDLAKPGEHLDWE